MESIIGKENCTNFFSNYMYYFGVLVLIIIAYMLGVRNGEKKSSKKSSPKKSSPKKSSKKSSKK